MKTTERLESLAESQEFRANDAEIKLKEAFELLERASKCCYHRDVREDIKAWLRKNRAR